MKDITEIVLVDDDPATLLATSRLLKAQGYVTWEAGTAGKGLELALAIHPDLVLSDVDLPDFSGIELCGKLKENPEMSGTHVVLISNSATDSDTQARAMELGADGYIVRPIPNRELLARVKAILRIQAAEAAVRAKVLQLEQIIELGRLGLGGASAGAIIEQSLVRVAKGIGIGAGRVLFIRSSPQTEVCPLAGACPPTEAGPLAETGPLAVASPQSEACPPTEAGSLAAARMRVDIHGENGLYGVLSVGASPSGEYSAEDEGFLQSVGNILSLAVMRRQSEEIVRFMAMHDSLTGLYNRTYFDAETEKLVAGRKFPVGIAMIDVDGLKRVNDMYGHGAGDRLLRIAGEALRACFRAEDIVSRIGGDEFAILVPETSEEGMAACASRVPAYLATHDPGMPGGFPVSVSIGCALAATAGEIESAQRLADERMYMEKAEHHKTLNYHRQ